MTCRNVRVGIGDGAGRVLLAGLCAVALGDVKKILASRPVE